MRRARRRAVAVRRTPASAVVGRPQLRRSPLSRYASPFRRKAKFGRSQRLKAAIVGLSAPSCRRVAGAGLRAPGAYVHGHGHTTQRPPRPSIIVRILGDVSEAEAGTGSGLLNAVQQFSGAIGVAVLGTVFFQRVSADGEFVRSDAGRAAARNCPVWGHARLGRTVSQRRPGGARLTLARRAAKPGRR